MSRSLSHSLQEAYRSIVPVPLRGAIHLSRQARSLRPFQRYFGALLVDPNVRAMAQRLRTVAGTYRGQRCFIMGSGPSLNEMDLTKFRDEFVWGLNKCYLLFDRIEWRPSHYVAIDTRVVPDTAAEIGRMIDEQQGTAFFFPIKYRVQGLIASEKNVYWYLQVPGDTSNLPFGAFTQDASEWVVSAATVTVAALQLAVYLGFDPIYLIGCDTSYSVPQSVRFENGNPVKLVSTQDDDTSHFDPSYFGSGSKWHDPRVDRMILHYEYAKQVCDHIGVTVYNATVGGKLEVFPRVDYTELF